MSKVKFTYDESGTTSFYFALSFLGLILLPATYYLKKQDKSSRGDTYRCHCDRCGIKRKELEDLYRWKGNRRKISNFLIVVGWALFFGIAYKCFTQQNEFVNWDPFEILGLPDDASSEEIKKTYRALSLKYHPDKSTGDPDKFVKISKAYAALTDEESRKNWEQYGNPDGPGATSIGIALPAWIVEKENSFLVLGAYIFMFMVVLPISVGIWWYSSVRYGFDKVLITTTELYYFFIHKTPNMAIKRIIMILAASLEFAKTHNSEVIERPEDNVEVPKLMREFNLLGEDNKERPLCFSYSIKTRTIIFAHLTRINLPAKTLEIDRRMIIRKCPYLLQEVVNCVSQLITLALSGRMRNKPTLLTLENAMKLSPMIVQAVWDHQNPLLQLPHFTDDIIRQIDRKKLQIKSIDQLARMTELERRDVLLKVFNVDCYNDINNVIASMPIVSVECKFEVLDDEDIDIITAGSIVTVTIKLTRKTYGEEWKRKNKQHINNNNNNTDNSNSNSNDNGSDSEANEVKDAHDSNKQAGDGLKERVDEREKVDEKSAKEIKDDEATRLPPSVHCPYFPDEKHEQWWVYLVDRKRASLVTAPIMVNNLISSEKMELKFTAPRQSGQYTYTVVVRSDSYVDAITQQQEKIDVKPMKDFVEPIHDVTDDEDEEVYDEESAVEDSDLMTDSDD